MTVSALLAAAVLGGAEAACRPGEPGPAVRILVEGLKDRVGLLRVELYPDDDADFLADDTALIAQGKPFRRLVLPIPPTGTPDICLRAPQAGVYALVVLHDRDGDGRFTPLTDGVAFPGNPRLGLAKPKAAQVSVPVGPGVSRCVVTLAYWRGLSFRPIRE